MTPDTERMQEQTDELQRDIDEARRQAQEHGSLPDSEPKQTYADPDGDGEEEDAGALPGGA